MIYILIFIFALIITTMLNGQSKMKLRCCITFQQIKIEEKIRSKIEYGEHFLILTSFPKNPNSLEMIRNFFFPPSNTFNIFLNTTQIIHRTFFEVAVKSMNCDLFTIEVDNSKYIKIDSMYNNFLYLRNLKNFLFDEENQKVNSFMFIDE